MTPRLVFGLAVAWVAVSAVFAVAWSLTVGRLPKDDDQ